MSEGSLFDISPYKSEFEALNKYYRECQDVYDEKIEEYKRGIKELEDRKKDAKKKIDQLEDERRQMRIDHRGKVVYYTDESEALIKAIFSCESNRRKAMSEKEKATYGARAMMYKEKLQAMNGRYEKLVDDIRQRKASVAKQMATDEEKKQEVKESMKESVKESMKESVRESVLESVVEEDEEERSEEYSEVEERSDEEEEKS